MTDVRDHLLKGYLGEHYDRVLKSKKQKIVSCGGLREVVSVVSVGDDVRVWDHAVLKRSFRLGKVKGFDDIKGMVTVQFGDKTEDIQANRVAQSQQ